jgi:hypothetical protein
MHFLHYDRLLPIRRAGEIVQRNRVGFSGYCVSRDMDVNEPANSVEYSTGHWLGMGLNDPVLGGICRGRRI